MKLNRRLLAALAVSASAVVTASAAEKADAKKMDKDAIVNGVHGYMPANYVPETDPKVKEHIEWYMDQKLGLMMHWGIYAQMGILESWAMCDKEAAWSRAPFIDWRDWQDGDGFRREYYGLAKSFNPVRFDPVVWAALAKECGFKYCVFTTKHHDGFCMFDSKYSDYKVTNKDLCPFATHPRANVVKEVFDAFRAEKLGVVAYFSKPDWHHPDYWENHGIGFETTRMPTYDVEKNPAKWESFREFTKNQLVELCTDYGHIDALWLDGGQVQKNCGLDIRIDDIIAECRKHQPHLVSVDRTAGGKCENIITPEQTVPPQPLAVPWESCITMGTGFSYRYDDNFKTPQQLVTLLIDIIAKGGNLALNIAPGPDGRFPRTAVHNVRLFGRWVTANAEGIFATRPTAPWRKGAWAFTTRKDGSARYAFLLFNERGTAYHAARQLMPLPGAEKVKKVTHLATGRDIAFKAEAGGLMITLPRDLVRDEYAEGFRVE